MAIILIIIACLLIYAHFQPSSSSPKVQWPKYLSTTWSFLQKYHLIPPSVNIDDYTNSFKNLLTEENIDFNQFINLRDEHKNLKFNQYLFSRHLIFFQDYTNTTKPQIANQFLYSFLGDFKLLNSSFNFELANRLLPSELQIKQISFKPSTTNEVDFNLKIKNSSYQIHITNLNTHDAICAINKLLDLINANVYFLNLTINNDGVIVFILPKNQVDDIIADTKNSNYISFWPKVSNDSGQKDVEITLV